MRSAHDNLAAHLGSHRGARDAHREVQLLMQRADACAEDATGDKIVVQGPA